LGARKHVLLGNAWALMEIVTHVPAVPTALLHQVETVVMQFMAFTVVLVVVAAGEPRDVTQQDVLQLHPGYVVDYVMQLYQAATTVV